MPLPAGLVSEGEPRVTDVDIRPMAKAIAPRKEIGAAVGNFLSISYLASVRARMRLASIEPSSFAR
jgi:hypothetical protein